MYWSQKGPPKECRFKPGVASRKLNKLSLPLASYCNVLYFYLVTGAKAMTITLRCEGVIGFLASYDYKRSIIVASNLGEVPEALRSPQKPSAALSSAQQRSAALSSAQQRSAALSSSNEYFEVLYSTKKCPAGISSPQQHLTVLKNT